MMAPQKPLLLKDYLELDCSPDSSSSSFSSFPRHPGPGAAAARGGARLVRSRSRGAFTRLSAVLAALKNLRLLPKKPKTVTVKDIVRLNSFDLYGGPPSFYLPSPAVSSCSSCSDGDEGSGSFLSSSSASSADCFPDSAAVHSPPPAKGRLSSSEGIERHVTGCSQSEEEEKEQLSPVSVMDFAYQGAGDDEGERSHRFEQSLANIERTTHQLLKKIRRFENLAELGPLDLDLRFGSPEGEGHVGASGEIGAWDLIRRLRTGCQVGPRSERLLVDFFGEGLSCSAGTAGAGVEGLLSTAGAWIDGGGWLKAEEQGKAQLGEMERTGRWGCFEGGNDDVAADVEGAVLGALLHELVLDLSMKL